VLESGQTSITVAANDIAGNVRQGLKIQVGPKFKLSDHTAIKLNYGYSKYDAPTVGGTPVTAARKENVFEASFVAKL
jgi:opacity protein-like surface antigen